MPRKYRYSFYLKVLISLGYSYIPGLQHGYSQLIGQFTQYYANELIINPAFAGTHNALSLTAMYRSQWSGLANAPSTQTFSMHSLTRNDHVGLGITFINDEIGIHKNLTCLNSYSYRLTLDEDTYIALGIQLGFNYRQSDYASLSTQVQDPNDPHLASGLSQFKFEFGSGIYYKSQKLRIGLSAPKMLTARASVSDSVSMELNRSQYFLFIRQGYPISHNVELQPAILIKYLRGLKPTLDFNVSADVKQVLLLGISYRLSESIGSILQLNITPQLKFGYAYDLVTTPTSGLSRSSHEIMINYLFRFTTYNIKNVR